MPVALKGAVAPIGPLIPVPPKPAPVLLLVLPVRSTATDQPDAVLFEAVSAVAEKSPPLANPEPREFQKFPFPSATPEISFEMDQSMRTVAALAVPAVTSNPAAAARGASFLYGFMDLYSEWFKKGGAWSAFLHDNHVEAGNVTGEHELLRNITPGSFGCGLLR